MARIRELGVLAIVACVASAGCVGGPSPLAPSQRGSIGVPHRGVLTQGAPLPKRGSGFERLRDNGRQWGNPRLIWAIEQAAAAVAEQRPGGAPLLVGDLSERFGGETLGHRSHRTGRDADLLFYVTTPAGRSIRSPGFVRIGPDGLAAAGAGKHPFVRIDVEREWLLIRSLVESPNADVLWLFAARWLEPLIIEYARARGEDPELIWHAENVLLQPGDSAPHDDHLHLRIACSSDDAVAGCAGGGPRWPWLTAAPPLEPPPDDELVRAIAGDLISGAPRGVGAAL